VLHFFCIWQRMLPNAFFLPHFFFWGLLFSGNISNPNNFNILYPILTRLGHNMFIPWPFQFF